MLFSTSAWRRTASAVYDAAVQTHLLKAADGASVEVANHGAHVLRWRSADGIERLFLSPRAEFHTGAAIRGGVPIIFPQFAGLGPLPKHGFARNAQWTCVDIATDGEARATFEWQGDDAMRAIWPHAFVARYEVAVAGQQLRLALSIRNAGTEALAFTAALHTYLQVIDIDTVCVEGLKGLRYRDSAAGDVERNETQAALRIQGEVDRIYFDASEVVVREGKTRMQLHSQGFPDVVVWNPGPEKCAALKDMEPQGYRHMLCIEAAVIGTPVVLAPGMSWQGMQMLYAAG